MKNKKRTIKYPKSEKWRKTKKYLDARDAFLAENRVCVICDKYCRVEPSTIMDHIRPHRDDYDLFWGVDNWQALCEYHHNQKTATEDGGMGNPERSHDWPDIGQRDLDCRGIMDGKDLF